LKVLAAEFVTSAASVAGAPSDPGPRVALVGRSNVGKSSLINALAGRSIARTSATPGRTRLANFYRVTLAATGGRKSTLFLVDLPGYGYARGGRDAQRAFGGLVESLFAGGGRRPGAGGRVPAQGGRPPASDPRPPAPDLAALLVVDARHPGLEADRGARNWLAASGIAFGVVATKVDKLSRAERSRALREIAATLEGPALAFSAATGEGRDELWSMIAELARGRAERPARE
jgi:GTP-binding protein